MAQFPNTRLTRREKIEKYGSVEEWAKEVFKQVDRGYQMMHYMMTDYFTEINKNYNFVEGVFDKNDMEDINIFYGDEFSKFEVKFPADVQHYDIVTTKVEQLRGEETKRPFNFHVVSSSPTVTAAYQEAKKNQITESLVIEIKNKLAHLGLAEQQIDEETGEPVKPKSMKEIEKYFQYDYKDIREIVGNRTLEYLYKYNELWDKFNDGWFNFLVSGADFYWTGVIRNEPRVRTVDPRFFDYDRTTEVKYVEDAHWAKEWRYISSSQVIEEYGDVLTEAQVDAIEKQKGEFKYVGYGYGVPIIYDSTDRGGGTAKINVNSTTLIRVVNLEFKALRKIGFLKYIDEYGVPQEMIVDEEYETNKKDPSFISIDWKWIYEVWSITKIGDNLDESIYINIGPKPNQHKSLDNPSKCKLGYTGILVKYPLVSKMRPLQELYNIMMYRLKLVFARAKGKTFIMDMAQLPLGKHGMTIEKWLYYADIMGVAFINSHEENKKNLPNTFNQFQQFDLTLSNSAAQYMVMLDRIEKMLGDLTGITPQRQGQTHASETVGGIERSITQSTYTTEMMFYIHNQVKRKVITKLLEVAQLTWIDGKKIMYYDDGLGRALLEVDGPGFAGVEFDTFVSDSNKDNEILQMVKSMAKELVQNGTLTMSEFLNIFNNQSLGENIKILELKEEAKKAFDQEMAQMQQETLLKQQQMQQEAEERKMEQERELKQLEIDSKERIADAQIEAQLQIAGIKHEDKHEEHNNKLIQEQEKFAHERELMEEEIEHEKNMNKLQEQKQKIINKQASIKPKKK